MTKLAGRVYEARAPYIFTYIIVISLDELKGCLPCVFFLHESTCSAHTLVWRVLQNEGF